MLAAHGAVIGVSRRQRLSRIVFVVRETYAQLPEQQRYEVARLIGRLCRKHPENDRGLMLIGPGRWGTSSPSLGIPVTFTEIGHASAICEVVAMHERLIPDVSLVDWYARLHMYVYVDGIFVNDTLVREGYALADSMPPDIRFDEQFMAAQAEAQAAQRGLWAAC